MKIGNGKVIDVHCHPAGPGFMEADGIIDYKDVNIDNLGLAEPERPENFFKKWDQHGVDMGIPLVSMGISLIEENEKCIELVQQYPDRFPGCMIGFKVPFPERNTLDGEKAAKELEPLFKMKEVVGLGEFPLVVCAGFESWTDLWPRYRPIMDMVAENKKACLIHTGCDPYPAMYPATRRNGDHGIHSGRKMYFDNPIHVDDIATEYPDIPIIIGHCGVQGYFYFGTYADMALTVAARHPNVYLETSSVPLEVLERACADPAIGPEKLVYGSDTPAPFGFYNYKGAMLPSYGKEAPPHTPDHYQYDIEMINQLPIDDRAREAIMGGNIARVLKLDMDFVAHPPTGSVRQQAPQPELGGYDRFSDL